MSPSFSHLAPEILLNQSNFTEKVDVYSFGLILWHLLTKQAPYVNYTNEEAFIEGLTPINTSKKKNS